MSRRLDIAGTVDALIRRSGMRQGRVDVTAGVGEAWLSEVRAGKIADMTIDKADRLAGALGVSLTDFVLMAYGELPLPEPAAQPRPWAPFRVVRD